ncbi:MAG: hypothetical protein LBU79_02205 [Planctomycetota bacterium]|jgi:hypothetical protein|nr:hypothetical protein [Planctomycetota bacterium]
MDENSLPTPPPRQSITIVRRQTRSSLQKNKLAYILLSLLLGILLWAGIDMKRMQDLEIEVDLGIEHIIPADWKCTMLSQNTILVSLRGNKQLISAIRADPPIVVPQIPTTAFDGDVYEATLGISSSQVRELPPGMIAFAVKPEAVTIRLERMDSRHIQVEPGEVVGTPAEGYTVGRVNRPDPPSLPVTGPKVVLDNLGVEDVLHTGPIDVQGKRGVVQLWLRPLPLFKNGRLIPIEGQGQVRVSVDLVEKPVVRTLEQPIDVKVLIDSPFDKYRDLTLSPPVVTVTVSGPQTAVDNLVPGDIMIYADIRERIPATTDEYNLKCRSNVPSRITVVKIEPDTVKWIIREAGGKTETSES